MKTESATRTSPVPPSKMAPPSAPPPGDDHWWNRKEVARHLGVSDRHVSSLMARNVIPFVKISPQVVRFDPKEVRAAMKKLEIKAA